MGRIQSERTRFVLRTLRWNIAAFGASALFGVFVLSAIVTSGGGYGPSVAIGLILPLVLALVPGTIACALLRLVLPDRGLWKPATALAMAAIYGTITAAVIGPSLIAAATSGPDYSHGDAGPTIAIFGSLAGAVGLFGAWLARSLRSAKAQQ